MRKGFTLMELMTVIGVFSILSLLIIAIHGQVTSLQRRTTAEQKVISDTRYALETMANALRIGTVYYAGYKKDNSDNFDASICGITSPGSIVYLIDEDEERVKYAFTPPSGSVNGYITKTFFGARGSAQETAPTSARLTAKDLSIRSFTVSIQPLCNPYNKDCVASVPTNLRQPLVTLSIGVDVPIKGGGTQTRYVQTAVSSRVYKNIADVCTPLP